MPQFMTNDERQRVLVLLVGVAEEFAVAHDEVVTEIATFPLGDLSIL